MCMSWDHLTSKRFPSGQVRSQYCIHNVKWIETQVLQKKGWEHICCTYEKFKLPNEFTLIKIYLYLRVILLNNNLVNLNQMCLNL